MGENCTKILHTPKHDTLSPIYHTRYAEFVSIKRQNATYYFVNLGSSEFTFYQ